MTDEQFEFVVQEVIRRLASLMFDSGRNDSLIIVFTGATVGLVEGVQQVRSLLLDGFQVKLVFSRAADQLFAEMINEQLDGFPNLRPLLPEKWLSSLREAKAVAVPLLSLNTVSKLSSLIADDLVSNILLHTLFLGKPLVLAKDGADPDGEGRQALNFHKGNAVLYEAIRQRLKTLEDFGCVLTGADQLAESVRLSLLQKSWTRPEAAPNADSSWARPSVNPSGKVTTSGDVLSAHRRGVNINLGPAGLATALARDLARRLGVELIAAGNR